jgi:hypothetical protein
MVLRLELLDIPEGNPDISDSDLKKAMINKSPFADYIVTTMANGYSPYYKF